MKVHRGKLILNACLRQFMKKSINLFFRDYEVENFLTFTTCKIVCVLISQISKHQNAQRKCRF